MNTDIQKAIVEESERLYGKVDGRFTTGANFILNNPELMKGAFDNFNNWLEEQGHSKRSYWIAKYGRKVKGFDEVFADYIESIKK